MTPAKDERKVILEQKIKNLKEFSVRLITDCDWWYCPLEYWSLQGPNVYIYLMETLVFFLLEKVGQHSEYSNSLSYLI